MVITAQLIYRQARRKLMTCSVAGRHIGKVPVPGIRIDRQETHRQVTGEDVRPAPSSKACSIGRGGPIS